MGTFDEFGENTQAAVRGESATLWSRLLYATAILYLVSGGVALLPSGGFFDVVLGLFALAFLACWLPFPLWLYKDRKRVREETDYRPSKLYYLGWLPGYLGVAAIFLYLHRRGRAHRRQLDNEADGEETNLREAERDAMM